MVKNVQFGKEYALKFFLRRWEAKYFKFEFKGLEKNKIRKSRCGKTKKL